MSDAKIKPKSEELKEGEDNKELKAKPEKIMSSGSLDSIDVII